MCHADPHSMSGLRLVYGPRLFIRISANVYGDAQWDLRRSGARWRFRSGEVRLMWDLRRLFVKHSGEIDRFLRRRGHSPETAADLTQDAFVRLIMAAPRDTDHPRAYLWQIARNLSVDFQRRERRVEFHDLSAESYRAIADRSPSPETVAYDRQRLMIVETAIQELPERVRRAFEMHRMGGKTLAEVAAELELSTSRTWALIRQAYLHLRDRLNDGTV